MKKFLSILLITAIVFISGAFCTNAENCSVTYLGEPFEERYTISATNTFDHWCIGNGLSSKVINTNGETLFNIIALGAKSLRNDVFLLTMPAQIGTNSEKLVNYAGEKLTDRKFEIIEPLNDNALVVKIDGKTGIYDFVKDEMIAEAEYTSYKLKKDSSGNVSLILLNSGEKTWEILDMRTLEKRNLPESLGYSFFSEKYLNFTGDKQGIADIYGNIIYVNESNKYVNYINDNTVTVSDYAAKTLSVCDMDGNVKYTFSTEKYTVNPIAVDENGTFFGLSYKTNGTESRLWGIMSLDGTLITEEKYYYVTSNPGFGFVVLSDFAGKECTVIDYSGNVIIPGGKYSGITYLGENLYSCYVAEEYKYDLVRINGTTAETLDRYGSILKLNDKYLHVSKDNKRGVINYSGEVIVPFEYESAEVLNDFLFSVSKNGKKGVADYYGNEIIECKYSAVTPSGAGRIDAETLLLKDAETNLYTFVEIKNPVTPEISVKVGGVNVKFDQTPVISEGRTLVPLRAIFEALGASVSWNGETRTVIAVKGDVTVSLTIDSDVMTVNGNEEKLDVPATIIGGRTLVPARAVSQALGYNVSWDGETRCVGISR